MIGNLVMGHDQRIAVLQAAFLQKKFGQAAMMGDKKEIANGLKSSAGFIRREIARRLNLRMTPEFAFHEDHSIEHGAHISKLLNGIEISPEEDSDDADGSV